jgi:hypothetical protein
MWADSLCFVYVVLGFHLQDLRFFPTYFMAFFVGVLNEIRMMHNVEKHNNCRSKCYGNLRPKFICRNWLQLAVANFLPHSSSSILYRLLFADHFHVKNIAFDYCASHCTGVTITACLCSVGAECGRWTFLLRFGYCVPYLGS